MQQLTRKEFFIALAGLAFLSATITFVDWWQRGQAGASEALIAGAIAIVMLFWAPLTAALALLKQLNKQRVMYELPLWLSCFYAGYRIWGFALTDIYPSVQLGWLDTFFMSLPWAVGTYVIYRAYCTYKALQTERLLRKQSQLNQLKQTLHPHFLFNSLNTLSAFIASDPAKAEQLTQDLASVLRHILDTDTMTTITLKHELLVLNKWLNIEQARLGDDLIVDFKVDEDALNCHLPPFVLQPLLENSIKHAQQLPIRIELDCTVRQGCLAVDLRDNGPGFPVDLIATQGRSTTSSGLGLTTTLKRIRLLENARYLLTNGPAPYGAVVAIELEVNYE